MIVIYLFRPNFSINLSLLIFSDNEYIESLKEFSLNLVIAKGPTTPATAQEVRHLYIDPIFFVRTIYSKIVAFDGLTI